jgi:hypothetical protein
VGEGVGFPAADPEALLQPSALPSAQAFWKKFAARMEFAGWREVPTV